MRAVRLDMHYIRNWSIGSTADPVPDYSGRAQEARGLLSASKV
jgi:hypothetical protein